MSRTSWAVVAAIALPILLIGCGGGGGGSSGNGGQADTQGLVNVQGIADLGGVPPDDAQILLDGQPLDIQINDDGSFTIPDIPEGEHTIQIVTRDGMRGGHGR